MSSICKLAIECKESKDKKLIIDSNKFFEMGCWLMINLNCVCGQRTQAARLLLNKHYVSRRTATNINAKSYMNILLKDSELKEDEFTIYQIGVKETEDHGKTDPITFVVPFDLSRTIDSYRIIKEYLGFEISTHLESAFFIKMNGGKITLKNYSKLKIVQQMAEVMGIPKFLITYARRGQAGRMIEKNLTNNLGMGHSKETQAKFYDTYKTPQGVQNITVANEKMLTKPMKISFEQNQSKIFQSMEEEDAKVAQTLIKKKLAEEQRKEFHGKVNARTGRHRVLSEEKVDLLKAILSWTCPEFSALILCKPYIIHDTEALEIYYGRFLCWKGEGMDKIRGNMANLSCEFEENKSCITNIVKVLTSSVKSQEKYRLRNGQPYIFFFESVVKNWEKNKKENEKLAEKEQCYNEANLVSTPGFKKRNLDNADDCYPATKKQKVLDEQ
jgi:hypothetical protein